MALIQDGAGGGGVLAIDPVSNAARVTFYDTKGDPILYTSGDQVASSAQAGLLAMGISGKTALPQRLDRYGSQASANIIPLLNESFDGTVLSPQRWSVFSQTMTAAQNTAAGFVMNNGSVVAANSGYLIRTARPYLKCIRQPLCCRTRTRISTGINAIAEFGFGDISSALGGNNTGAYWQVTASGGVVPVLEFNTTMQTGTDIRPLLNTLGVTNYYNFDVIIDDESATFICTDSASGQVVSQQVIALNSTGIRILSSTQISYFIHLYITGTAATSVPVLAVADAAVWSLDSGVSNPLSHLMASQGRGADVNPLSGVQLQQWANSAEASSAVLSNSAPAYAANLGGKFQFGAVAGSVTDYALFAYQMPAGTNMFITGIDIDTWNTGVANGSTATLLQWSIAASAQSNQLNAVTSRLGIGSQTLAAAAAVGTTAQRISKQYQTPLFCAAGRYVIVALRIPVGLATASQVIQGMVNFEGYFA